MSSQVIWGAGVPSTEHCSTKSWPSMTLQSFRTLENEGAASILASPVNTENREAISDHSWPTLVTDCSYPKSCRQTPHCLQHPGLSLLPGFTLSRFIPGRRHVQCRDLEPETEELEGVFFTVTKCPRSGSAPGLGLPSLPWDSGTSCLVLVFAILEHPQTSFFLPFLVLLYFLVSLIFFMSHW